MALETGNLVPTAKPTQGKRPAAEDPWVANLFDYIDFTIGTKSANVINVALQLKNSNNFPLGQTCTFDCYVSDTADGLTPSATAITTIAVGTNGALIVHVAGITFWATCNANGMIDINLTYAGSHTWYLVVCTPSGRLVISPAITF